MLIRLLGEVSAGEDAESLSPPRGRVATSVLAVLALARGRLVTTESLIDDLWEVPPDTARNAIQVAVSGLRKQFGQALVDGSRVGYRLRTDLVRIDWLEVEQYLVTARDQMNRGDLVGAEADASSARTVFAGSELAGADSSSVRASRGVAAQLRRTASVVWAEALVGLGRRDEAIAVLTEEANLSALDEPVHVLLMSVLREQGRSAEALEIFEALRRRLDDELGVSPSSDAVDEFHRLLDSGAEVESELLELGTPSAANVSLPASATPLLGREAEVSELVDLMRSGNALVTLLGPGGIGKTRLGVAAARALAELDQRPAIFVDLTRSRSDGDTRQLLADLLTTEPETITDALASSRMVVLMDNAEHLVEETAALVAELVDIPDVRLLVTSRAALELVEERRYEVDGLRSNNFESPAVQLLVNRAALNAAEAKTSATALQALAQRCDGIPLIMELLGAALRWESPSELLASLDVELPMVRDQSRNRADRHASVREAIGWSLDQLSPSARRALGVLATVRGTFDAATAAALVTGVGIPDAQAALAELVDSSLVKRVRDPGAITFRILEPIRLVAERLDEPQAQPNLEVHADVYLAMLAEAHGNIAQASDAFEDLMVRETPNLVLAAETRWAAHPARAVGAIAQLQYGFYRRDRVSETRSWAAKVFGSRHGSRLDLARVGIAWELATVRYVALGDSFPEEEFARLNALIEEAADELDDEWHRRWVAVNWLRWEDDADHERAEAWIARMRLTNSLAVSWVHYAKLQTYRSSGRWSEAIHEGEAGLRALDPGSQIVHAIQIRSDLAAIRIFLGEFDSAEAELREIVEYTDSHGLGFERTASQLNLAFLTALTARLRECLTFVLATMDWSGRQFGIEGAIYAAIALHESGDDTAAHALVSLVATSYLGEAIGKPRPTDELYLRPHWERLLEELPEVTPDPAGGWETSLARDIVTDALARLPAAG